jgi:hypothetical protein
MGTYKRGKGKEWKAPRVRELLWRAEPDGVERLVADAVFGRAEVVRLLVVVQGVKSDRGVVQGCTAFLLDAEIRHAGVVEFFFVKMLDVIELLLGRVACLFWASGAAAAMWCTAAWRA